MKYSFYASIISLCILLTASGTAFSQISATVTATGTTCGHNNGSAIVIPSGGSNYTYVWSAGGSATATDTGLAPGTYTVTVTSTGGTAIDTIFLETFGTPSLPASGWTLNIPSDAITGVTTQADSNYWKMDDGEGGQPLGSCGGDGTAAGNGNNTLYITDNQAAVNSLGTGTCAFSGCTYLADDAGGDLCGFFGVCPGTSLMAISPAISTVGQTNLSLTFDYITVGDNTDFLTVYYSTNGGASWTLLTTPPKTASPGGCSPVASPPGCIGGAPDPRSVWTHLAPVTLPAACNNISNLKIGFNWQNPDIDPGTPTDPSAAIDNLLISSTVAGGSPGSVIDTFTISPSQAPSTPIIGPVTQPTCTDADGSFTISNYSALNTYTFLPAAGVTRIGNTVTVPALDIITVTSDSAGCVSAQSVAVPINAQPATPATPTTGGVVQPTCASDGSFTITNYSGTLTYTITPNTGVSQTNSIVTAPAGSYTVTATNASGCTSAASVAVVLTAAGAPAQPALGNATQPTCISPDGSFIITNYNSAYSYTITPMAGVIQTDSAISAPSGSYTVTATSAGCTSSPSAAMVLTLTGSIAQPTLGNLTQPTCAAPNGSFIITNYNAAYTYTITPLTGVTRTDSAISAPAGSYTVTAASGPCTSPVSAPVVLNAAAGAPATPSTGSIVQPCSALEGTFIITNYNAAYTYTIQPIAAGATQFDSLVSAPAGSYTVAASSAGCMSGYSAAVTINAPLSPDAGPDQLVSCIVVPGGSATMAGTGAGTWTASAANPGTSTIVTPGSPTTGINTFSAAGAYTYIWTIAAGCADTAAVVVTTKPDAGPDQTICQYSTATLAAIGTGTWYADNNNLSVVTFSSVTSPTATATGFILPGTFSYYWVYDGCADTMNVVVAPTPAAAVTSSHDTLFASPSGVTYQWLESGTAIAGATSQIYLATASGSYAVIETEGSCTDTSTVYAFTYISPTAGISNVNSGNFSIWPNPFNDHIEIDLGNQNSAYIEIYSLLGSKLISGTYSNHASIDMTGLSSGVYIIQVGNDQMKATKMISKQ